MSTYVLLRCEKKPLISVDYLADDVETGYKCYQGRGAREYMSETNKIRMITMCVTLHHSHNTYDNYTLTQLTPIATITSVANHNITKTQIDSYSSNNKGYTTTLIQQS